MGHTRTISGNLRETQREKFLFFSCFVLSCFIIARYCDLGCGHSCGKDCDSVCAQFCVRILGTRVSDRM